MASDGIADFAGFTNLVQQIPENYFLCEPPLTFFKGFYLQQLHIIN